MLISKFSFTVLAALRCSLFIHKITLFNREQLCFNICLKRKYSLLIKSYHNSSGCHFLKKTQLSGKPEWCDAGEAECVAGLLV